MNSAELVQHLTDMGYVVKNYDVSALYIQDPSCILSGFSTFMEYAWIVIVALAGFMLMLWGIGMLRGAKNDIFTNLRNLTLIFGILGAAIPIINFIWGDNIMAAACDTITVPMERINAIIQPK